MPTLIYYVVAFDPQRSEYLVIEIFASDEHPARVVGRFDDQAAAEREAASWMALAEEMAA